MLTWPQSKNSILDGAHVQTVKGTFRELNASVSIGLGVINDSLFGGYFLARHQCLNYIFLGGRYRKVRTIDALFLFHKIFGAFFTKFHR